MAQENTAINDLIHLVTAPKLREREIERESVEDLFWARNQVNLRGQRALETSAPMPIVHAHAPAPVMTMPMGSMSNPLPMNDHARSMSPPAGSAANERAVEPMRMLPMTTTLPMGGARHAQPAERPASAGYMLTATPSGGMPTAQATPGALHAQRVAVARATAAKGGPAARAAAARAAAARSLDAQGATVSTSQVPSAAARAIAAQAVIKGTPANGAAVRGVMPIFHDDEDDAATIRVEVPALQAAHMQAPTMQRPMAQSIAPGAVALAPVAHAPVAHAPVAHAPVAHAPHAPVAHYPAGQFAVAPLTDPTVRVTPLAIELPSKPRSFAREFQQTVKRFAAPLAVLMVVAIFAGGYLAFDGQGGKPRPAAAASETPAAVASETPAAAASETPAVSETPAAEGVAPAASPTVAVPTVTPILEPNSVSAVIASKLAEARAAESMELAKGAVVVGEEAADEAVPEIEMEAVELAKTKRTARSAKSSKSRKRLAAVSESTRASKKAKRAEKIAKAKAEKLAKAEKKKPETEDKSIAEAALPANVANKTDSANGKVSVTSNVPAMIYLDGRSTQMMTPKKFAVPAGKHKITLLEPTSKKAKTQDIEVAAGKTSTIDKQF